MVLELRTNDDKAKPETETLFSIDGIPYDIPKRFGANIALQYARIVRERGSDQAVGWALEKALGRDGYSALMAFDDLEVEDLETITVTVLKRIAAGMEAPKGGLKAV